MPSSRAWIFAPALLFASVLIGAGAYWYFAANAFGARLDAVNGREIMPGVVFAFAEREISGFPFRIDAVLEGVTVSLPSAAGETAWRSERIAIHRLVYQNKRFVYEVDGLQTLSWPGSDGKTRILHLRPGLARASAILEGTRLARFDSDLVRVLGQEITQGVQAEREFTAARVQAHLLARPDRNIDLFLRADEARIGGGYDVVLGRELSFTLSGKVEAGEALERLLGGNQNPSEALQEWRQSNGRIEAARLELASELYRTLVLAGALTLNDMLRLEGTLTTLPGAAMPVSVVITNGEIQN
jgi:hypothetical protein